MGRINIIEILYVLVHTGWANPIFLATQIVAMDTGAYCAPGYQQPANSNWTMCYKIITDQMTKSQASQECSTWSNGTLVSVPNAFVNSYLYSLARGGYASSLWLGIHCTNNVNSTTCINEDATPFVYNNFNPGQPDATHHCVYMTSIGRYSQYWFTSDCEQEYSYACETPVEQIYGALDCPVGYDAFNGTCYQYFEISPENQISGSSASTKCGISAPGGTLATIGSAELNQFLMSKQKGVNSYTAFGLICAYVKTDGDRSSCYWEDETPYGSYSAFKDIDTPSAYYGGGCCDFNKGAWADCWDCSEDRFDSYICQAPMQKR